MVVNFCSWAGALLARLSATAAADSPLAADLNLVILHSPHTLDAILLRCARQRCNGGVDGVAEPLDAGHGGFASLGVRPSGSDTISQPICERGAMVSDPEGLTPPSTVTSAARARSAAE